MWIPRVTGTYLGTKVYAPWIVEKLSSYIPNLPNLLYGGVLDILQLALPSSKGLISGFIEVQYSLHIPDGAVDSKCIHRF